MKSFAFYLVTNISSALLGPKTFSIQQRYHPVPRPDVKAKEGLSLARGDVTESLACCSAMKNGAVRSGTYVKDKAVAGTTYLKERDWSREKEFAGKAGTATKS